MASTILDVAKLSGYSKATVSRAFANPEQVAEQTRRRIYEAARILNYTPDAIARAMARADGEYRLYHLRKAVSSGDEPLLLPHF